MIILRPATFADHGAIAQLHAESWKKNYRRIWSDDFLDNQVDDDRLSVWFQRLKSPEENQHVTVAVADHAIVGFCCLYLNEDPVFGSLVDNLHVRGNLQKSGIGRMLLTDCALWIRDKSTDKKMYLWVYDANTNAKAVYERLGGLLFERIERTNEDRTRAMSCRYIWNDSGKFLNR